MKRNVLLCTDVYKMNHGRLYPEGTTKIYSYLCARNSRKYNASIFFGLQYYLKEYLSRPITKEDVDEFLDIRKSILGSNQEDDIKRFYALAKLGYWPISIKAVPEGTVIHTRNALATMTNTHEDFAWTVGFLESLILKVWNTTTVATSSYEFRQLFDKFADKTSDTPEAVPFQVHDFGYRGCSSEETAALSGAAHLVSFLGTDTVPAVKLIKDYYGCEGPIGLSVPATEHSVMCAFGKDHEIDAFRRMLKQNPTGIVSIVSDTYDLWNVLINFTEELRSEIIGRDGKVVFRPDSGDQKLILCGDPMASIGSPARKGVFRILDEKFGHTVNSKGFKVLNDKVGVIYGDGMYLARTADILETLMEMGYASTNLVIGVGGILLQSHNRDDLGFAIKATFAVVNGERRELFKDPLTDHGKRSHKGLMKVVEEDGRYVTIDQIEDDYNGILEEVFRDGKLTKEFTFDQVRQNVIDRPVKLSRVALEV